MPCAGAVLSRGISRAFTKKISYAYKSCHHGPLSYVFVGFILSTLSPFMGSPMAIDNDSIAQAVRLVEGDG